MFFAGYDFKMSLVASRNTHDQMLSFAAKHDIKPKVEIFPMSEGGFADCWGKLKDGTLRYRGVLAA
jgi:D-arabinose 1-dehydrogenase-like Zn-dependent alcohol dehydrogenase